MYGDKVLVDAEPVVKDVCTHCNNVALSSYDIAGRDLLRQLLPSHDPSGLILKVTREVVCWLLKTHLNHFRVIKDDELSHVYPVHAEIRDALIQHTALPTRRFKMLVEGWVGEPYFWDAEDARHLSFFHYRSVRFRQQRIILSDFRIKTLTTWLVVPSDDDYADFEDRAASALAELAHDFGWRLQLIDVDAALKDGVLALTHVLPLEDVKKFVYPTKQDTA